MRLCFGKTDGLRAAITGFGQGSILAARTCGSLVECLCWSRNRFFGCETNGSGLNCFVSSLIKLNC
jgi:hypothetical protein